MGLFSWLFGGRARVSTRDLVWLTDAARLRGAAESVRHDILSGKSVLVVAQFPSTLAAFRAQTAGCEAVDVSAGCTPASALALARGSHRVLLALGRTLRPDEFPAPDAPASPLPVLALERHFLREHDDRIARFAEGLGSRAAVDFHVSLDDPLMKLFAGDWVRGVLGGLGMKEDEALDSGLVGRRIAAAQARLAATTPADHEADSPAAWLERNRAG